MEPGAGRTPGGRVLVLVAVGLLMAACAATAAPAASSVARTGATPLAVVASTNVWGDIASVVGGDQVAVTSLISDPSADPHSYEANGHNQLAVADAALIIENGGGYDDFVHRMIASAGSHATVLDAVQISGHQPVDGELNEHVWYDFPTVTRVAARIAAALSAADPASAPAFATRLAAFTSKVTSLEQREAAIKVASGGVGVAITEPVPAYLLAAAGLVTRTPAAFSKAIESGNDAPAAVVAQNLALFAGKKVRALVYNEQTTGPQTEQVLAAAKANGIAVVPVTETLPAGTDYLGWMTANVEAIAAAVRR